MQFGETNAGEPYRLMICAIVRAMGIVVNGERFNDDETRWASLEIQQNYIRTRPYLVRNYKITTWNQRYMQYKDLIEKITVNKVSGSKTQPFPLETGKYVIKNKKTFVPLVLFFVLSGYYALITGPYYAAQSNPVRNIPRLQIKVANFDSLSTSSSLSLSTITSTTPYMVTDRNGMIVLGNSASNVNITIPPIGDYFLEYVRSYKQSHDFIPDLQFTDSLSPTMKSTSHAISTLQGDVLDQEAWATVYVNTDATMSFLQAIEGGCLTNPSAASTYNAKEVITFAWDEGRNAAVSGPYVAAFLRNLITNFGYSFDQLVLDALNSALVPGSSSSMLTSCIANGYKSFISHTVSFSEINLTPVAVSPVCSAAGITVGQIYVAVFGANYIVSATYANTGALAEDLSPFWKVMLRAGTMALLGLGLSICFSTLSKYIAEVCMIHYTDTCLYSDWIDC